MHLIHSNTIPTVYLSAIKNLFPDIVLIPLPASPDVYPSISSHPDIFMCQLDERTFVHSPSLPETFINNLKHITIGCVCNTPLLILSDTFPLGAYPETTRLNAARVGNYIFTNSKFADQVLLQEAEKRGLKVIHVNQGYARCSIVPVGNNALITSDKGIHSAAKDHGIHALLISQGHIELPGEKYGFIGGTCGVMPDGSVFFLGDIMLHPEHNSINSFLRSHNISYSHLDNHPLFDCGSLFFIGNI